MRKRYGMGVWAMAAAMVALPGWAATPQKPVNEVQKMQDMDKLVGMMSVGANKTITFSDDKGQTISEMAFLDGVKAGRAFSYKRNVAAQSTAFTLEAKKAASDAPNKGAAALEHTLNVSYKVKPGQALPAFHLATVGGGSVDNAALRGKPALINFFFADCVGCIAETPALNAYAKAHPEVRVLAVTFDKASDAADYVKQQQFAWPVAYGGQSWFDTLGVSTYPALALVGADGRLLDIRISGTIQSGGDTISAKDLNRWVAGTLAKQTAK